MADGLMVRHQVTGVELQRVTSRSGRIIGSFDTPLVPKVQPGGNPNIREGALMVPGSAGLGELFAYPDMIGYTFYDLTRITITVNQASRQINWHIRHISMASDLPPITVFYGVF